MMKQTTVKSINPFECQSVIKEVDAIISQCMNDVSHEDRQQSYLEVHGVSGKLEETPSMIQDALKEIRAQISKIAHKDALELATDMDADYVYNPSLHLQFLRGEKFNGPKAAEKLVRHFEFKLELFGRDKLVKDIEQEDLNPEDIKALYSGYVQWLPLRDISGRTVTIFYPGRRELQLASSSKMRVFFYLRMIAMEDVAFQKKGLVLVVSAADCDTMDQLDIDMLKQYVKDMARLSEGLPGYTQSVHLCFPRHSSFGSLFLFSMARYAIVTLSKLITVRFRIHDGSSHQECMNQLQAFGIPISVIPPSPSNNEYHTNVLQRRKRLERERQQRRNQPNEDQLSVSSPSSYDPHQYHDSEQDPQSPSGDRDNFTVSFDPLDENCTWLCAGPGPSDVVLGRGRTTNIHPGNIRLRAIVEELKGVYTDSTKEEKKAITKKIVARVQMNGRFLKETKMIGWVEVPDEVARIKVSHAFRDTHRVRRKN